ncbi:putative motility protein [Neptuniibacter halophilus]|uniref:putative motility protein n=1 Tax=Neptuniibacter halophilus TaxID=651666 RepID=UPI002572EDFE|nr:putative motility protein [Neptuniibacter halophilus]
MMDGNDIAAAATTASNQQLQSSHAVKSAEMAKDQIEQTGDQIMQLLEVTAPGKLRVDPLSPLGTQIDVKA